MDLLTCPARRRFWRASDSRGSLLTLGPDDAAAAQILNGSPDRHQDGPASCLPNQLSPKRMRELKRSIPINTVVMSISRVRKDHALVQTARELIL